MKKAKTTLTDGSPVTADHRDIDPATGQQKGYVVLSEEERAKGYVRPVRNSYIHTGKNPQMDGIVLIKPDTGACGQRTKMSAPLAETYARQPDFYNGTFCAACGEHFPLEQFRWEGSTEIVGS